VVSEGVSYILVYLEEGFTTNRKYNKETMKAWSLFLLYSVLPGAVDGARPTGFAIPSQFLYEGKEDASAVTEYKTGVDFMDSKAPKIVEFYSPFCG
jgi:hypothetical protein